MVEADPDRAVEGGGTVAVGGGMEAALQEVVVGMVEPGKALACMTGGVHACPVAAPPLVVIVALRLPAQEVARMVAGAECTRPGMIPMGARRASIRRWSAFDQSGQGSKLRRKMYGECIFPSE